MYISARKRNKNKSQKPTNAVPELQVRNCNNVGSSSARNCKPWGQVNHSCYLSDTCSKWPSRRHAITRACKEFGVVHGDFRVLTRLNERLHCICKESLSYDWGGRTWWPKLWYEPLLPKDKTRAGTRIGIQVMWRRNTAKRQSGGVYSRRSWHRISQYPLTNG